MLLSSLIACDKPAPVQKIDAGGSGSSSPYNFTRGFPADEETIQKAQDASDLRRATEASNTSRLLLKQKRLCNSFNHMVQ